MQDYFIAEIREREKMSKTLSKYIATFDYFDQTSLVLLATHGSLSIALYDTIIGGSKGITSARPSLAFSFSNGIERKILKTMRKKKKQYNKLILAAS